MATTQDPIGIVYDNYVKWKGTPLDMTKPATVPEHLSQHFQILEYPGDHDYRVFCTVGASATIIPHSSARFKNEHGVRYEYLLHALPLYRVQAWETLLMVATYPFLQNYMYYAGSIIPIGGTLVEGSPMAYLYFTYPYEDDPKIYDPPSWGQIERDDVLIQTLWVFPIHKSEAHYVETNGPDAFEEVCGTQPFASYDFFRAPLV